MSAREKSGSTELEHRTKFQSRTKETNLTRRTKSSVFHRFKHPASLHYYYAPIVAVVVVVVLVVPISFLMQANCLRISSIEIPSAVPNGSQVTLVCDYELAGDDQLYSVKWYKNYVEFYRFQPQEQASSTARVAEGEQQQQQVHQKHEFELDGINLDLSKSNGTHVHLKQVSLATESTFKCEVSADSPTFATVSAERQLKVYVLPKQKISLIDHSQQQQQQQQQHYLPAASQGGTTVSGESNFLRQQQAALFQYNDFINLTCVSGVSRPAAQLSWFINEMPIRLNANMYQNKSAATTNRLINVKEATHLNGQKLMETRSNLVLNLQPNLINVLAELMPTGSGLQSKPLGQMSGSRQQLRIKCLSKLSLQYQSESKMTVSAGKTTPIKRSSKAKQQSTSSPLPTPLSLLDSESVPRGGGVRFVSPRARLIEQQLEPPIYSWPPNNRHRSRQDFQDWNNSTVSQRRYATSGQNVNVVWTSKQLKNQADFIERLLRALRPNELEAPTIEAKTVARPSWPASDNDDLDQVESDVNKSMSSIPPRYLDDEDEDSSLKLRESSASPTKDIIEDEGRETKVREDYELNEQVQFICSTRKKVPALSVEDTDSPLAMEQAREVHLNWFINDKEVSADRVNSFDGDKFTYRQSTENSNPKNRHNTRLNRQSPRRTSPGLIEKPLSVELTPELFQLKELAFRCRQVVEHALIEFEGQWIGQLAMALSSPPGSIEGAHIHSYPSSSSELQQQQQPGELMIGAQQSGHPATHQRQMGKQFFRHHNSSRSQQQQQQINNNNNFRQQGNSNNVIRLRQHQGSSSASVCPKQSVMIPIMITTSSIMLTNSLRLLMFSHHTKAIWA